MPALPATIMDLTHLHLSDLAKRDNMGYAIPPTVIVIIIIFGAACVTACCFAVYQLFGNVRCTPTSFLFISLLGVLRSLAIFTILFHPNPVSSCRTML